MTTSPGPAEENSAAVGDLAEDSAEGPSAPQGGASGRRPRSRRLVILLAVAVLGVIVAAGTWSGSRHSYQAMRITGGAMEPTYKPGDSVLVRKQSGASPHRGEVVMVATSQWGLSGDYLKRVIGVAGDHVVLPVAGPLTVNGKAVTEPYVLDGVANGVKDVDITVPAGRLFLLGDHRVDSIDGRMHLDESDGTLPSSEVVGRAMPDNHAVLPYFAVSAVAALVAAVAAAMAVSTWRKNRRRDPRRSATIRWSQPPPNS
jgi:signal peptidase I